MRVQLQNDVSVDGFVKQLLDRGHGKISIDESTQYIALPTNFCKITATTDRLLIDKIFPNIVQNYRNHQWLSAPQAILLASKNNDVNTINFSNQNGIPGDTTTYKTIDIVMNQNEVVNYPTKFLNSLDLPGMPPHVLILNVPIILLRNINPPHYNSVMVPGFR